MKKTIFSFLFCTFAYVCVSQISSMDKIYTRTSDESLSSKVVYDTLSNFEFQKNADYSKYLNLHIFFYPQSEKQTSKVEYYSNFYITRPVIVRVDTIWKKRRKRPKPKDYTIKKISSKRYKANYTKSWCISNGAGETPYTKGYYFTPKEAIEGKTFKIINIVARKLATDEIFGEKQNLSITLLSQSGDTLVWKNERVYSYSLSLCPIIIEEYVNKLKRNYVGKSFFGRKNFEKWTNKSSKYKFKNKYFEQFAINLNENGQYSTVKGKLKCIDLSLVGIPDSYKIPMLILEDGLSQKFAIPLLDNIPKVDSDIGYPGDRKSNYSDIDYYHSRRMYYKYDKTKDLSIGDLITVSKAKELREIEIEKRIRKSKQDYDDRKERYYNIDEDDRILNPINHKLITSFDKKDFKILTIYKGNLLVKDKSGKIGYNDDTKYDREFSNKVRSNIYQEALTKKKYPIFINYLEFTGVNSAGGVSFEIEWYNTSKKSIKYLTFNVTPFNRVGDKMYGEINNQSSLTVKATGPFESSNKQLTLYWENVWYNSDVRNVRLDGASVEFMDGTKKYIKDIITITFPYFKKLSFGY